MTNISGKTLSVDAVKKKIRTAVSEKGGFRRAAEKWSTDDWQISATYLRGVVNGPERPSKRLCLVIGFELIKEVKYRYREIK